ncbi:hypothetical protein M441DRAFT_65615 [Trichoderma asperellum CBS 433.97]|uniref:Uncharacterized protein n=1 Tax=Trichoderma asperellum (strain ATCC 204424 / CBS 433.97 / NBRC 101777) TaxID=1042311 RepID=A0A2T3ZG83_TRIA4|nr:hypothetical protein M441DRAFT_65615 [Trichoderma asperellum CBS 433.97]PTB43815.1 hypothetical protein M441DRAFT_65615 [Trichoderma asperellum CBS 433.97]
MTTDSILDIMKNLSISDALSMKNSYPQNSLLRACYDERISPVSYLQDTFDYVITLMAAMFDTGCILSGSRALEFFIPGSICPDSDWDFYVPAYKESVVDMVNALQICGVEWNTDAKTIASDLFHYGKAAISRQMLENLDTWVTNLSRKSASLILGKRIYDIVNAYRQIREETPSDIKGFELRLDPNNRICFISISDGWARENEEIPYNDALGRSFSILHGKIETKRGHQRVQLIIGSYYNGIKSCMAFVKDFYASHVQCFIGGWCASHLYYKEARSKKAKIWRDVSAKNNLKIISAIEKYKRRGFEFADAECSGVKIRALNDDDALLIEYGKMYREFISEYRYPMLNDMLNERRENISGISWTEFNGRIVSFQSVLESYFRTKKITFAGSELPMSSRRRLGNIIAARVKNPDKLRSTEYCSSVKERERMNELMEGWAMHVVATSGTTRCYLQDATLWAWTL